jgi:hypothetical protein
MKRTKILIAVGCLQGLALAWLPAYASPTSKKITATCISTNGADAIHGSVTVRLCASIDSCPDFTFVDVQGSTVTCAPTIDCDANNNTVSVTQTCDAPFKVGAAYAEVGCTENTSPNCGTAFTTTVKGKGAFLPDTTTDGDGVTVQIK